MTAFRVRGAPGGSACWAWPFETEVFDMLNNNRYGMLLLAALLSLCCAVLPAAAEPVSYDIAGRWMIEGEGYGEKRVRVQLALDGTLDIQTGVVEGRRCITGYDLWLRIDASRLNIKAWTERYRETLHVPVPLPDLQPTLNKPFSLPAVRTKEGLIYKVTLTSVTSGKVDIYGTIDLDVIGRTEIQSTSAIWKEGTGKPRIDDVQSGCGLGMGAMLLMVPLLLPLARRCRP